MSLGSNWSDLPPKRHLGGDGTTSSSTSLHFGIATFRVQLIPLSLFSSPKAKPELIPLSLLQELLGAEAVNFPAQQLEPIFPDSCSHLLRGLFVFVLCREQNFFC